MGPSRPTRIRAVTLTAIVASAWLLACGDREPSTTGPDAPLLAQGGGTSGPTVKDVQPDSAAQDTTLDIVVSGSGYDQGSQVTLALQGVPSEEVRTNATAFVNSRKLIANITIAADADTGAYDVAVTTLDGRRGIGIEMFTVHGKPEAAKPADVTIVGETTPGVANLLAPDATGLYRDGVCGARGEWSPTNAAFWPRDFGLTPKQERDLERDCPDFPRVVTFDVVSARVHAMCVNASDLDRCPSDPLLHENEPNVGDLIAAGVLDPVGDRARMTRATVRELERRPERGGHAPGGFNLAYCLGTDARGRPFRFDPDRHPETHRFSIGEAGAVLQVRTQAFPNNVGSCAHQEADGTWVVLLLHMDLAYDLDRLAPSQD